MCVPREKKSEKYIINLMYLETSLTCFLFLMHSLSTNFNPTCAGSELVTEKNKKQITLACL